MLFPNNLRACVCVREGEEKHKTALEIMDIKYPGKQNYLTIPQH